ncbi:MAG TPA: hypothetical protein VLH75_05585 [Longimicrobiales bacterium]|nr:hypothetical protein [Longimicrobiales bacterium]
MTAAPIRRGLLVTGLVVLVLAALMDLLRHDSLLRRAWSGLQPDRQTPAEQAVEEFQRTRGQSIRR